MVSRKLHGNVFKRRVLRFPRLDTLLMVEAAIMRCQGNNAVVGVRELWMQLPKRVMWQTLLAALDYLEYSEKISFNVDRKIEWVWQSRHGYKSSHIAVVHSQGVEPLFNPFFA